MQRSTCKNHAPAARTRRVCLRQTCKQWRGWQMLVQCSCAVCLSEFFCGLCSGRAGQCSDGMVCTAASWQLRFEADTAVFGSPTALLRRTMHPLLSLLESNGFRGSQGCAHTSPSTAHLVRCLVVVLQPQRACMPHALQGRCILPEGPGCPQQVCLLLCQLPCCLGAPDKATRRQQYTVLCAGRCSSSCPLACSSCSPTLRYCAYVEEPSCFASEACPCSASTGKQLTQNCSCCTGPVLSAGCAAAQSAGTSGRPSQTPESLGQLPARPPFFAMVPRRADVVRLLPSVCCCTRTGLRVFVTLQQFHALCCLCKDSGSAW